MTSSLLILALACAVMLAGNAAAATALMAVASVAPLASPMLIEIAFGGAPEVLELRFWAGFGGPQCDHVLGMGHPAGDAIRLLASWLGS